MLYLYDMIDVYWTYCRNDFMTYVSQIITMYTLIFTFFFSLKRLEFIYLCIFYFWLCWVFVSVWGLSLVAASGGHSPSQRAGLSLSRPLLLQSTGSRHAGSVVVAHRPSCSAACGIFPDQGSNTCPLHWQADSQPLCHQGSPQLLFLMLLAQVGLSWWAVGGPCNEIGRASCRERV